MINFEVAFATAESRCLSKFIQYRVPYSRAGMGEILFSELHPYLHCHHMVSNLSAVITQPNVHTTESFIRHSCLHFITSSAHNLLIAKPGPASALSKVSKIPLEIAEMYFIQAKCPSWLPTDSVKAILF